MTCRAQNEIVLDAARGRRAGTLDRKRERFAFGEAKRVASARQSDKTFERVPAVGAASGHMQGQIDFRGRAFGDGLGQDGCRGQGSLDEIIGRPAWTARLAISRTALRGAVGVGPRGGADQPPFFFGSV